VTAIDVNSAAVRACIKNSVVNGLEDRITAIVGDVRSMEFPREFDLVVSNPPQLPTGAVGAVMSTLTSWVDTANNGGSDGRSFINWLCGNSANLLTEGGVLMFTHFDYLEPGRTVRLLNEEGFEVSIERGLRKNAGPLSIERMRSLGIAMDSYQVLVVSARYGVL
jgi:methylase of polypeptide subunit release factors